MTIRIQRDAEDLELLTGDLPAAPSPGKRTMTHSLTPRSIVFRVESAEAARELGAAFGHRDGNGVAERADAAVERAAAGSGEPLRADVRERFESSLGADLSAIRVHRSADSALASTAVGARAYTVGNDIHFGAGQYQPDDPFGLHLLAHEVAHTQQQAGATPHRQHKLEVSIPGDAAEVDADRAADAMVTGAPAAVAGGGGVARKVWRDYRSEMDKAADDGGAVARSGGNDKVMGVKTVKDQAEASRALQMITGYTSELQEGVASEDTKPFMLKANNAAIEELNQFTGAAQAQDVGISNFKVLYKNVQVAYARLDAMANTAGVSVGDKNKEKGVSAASGKDLAKDHIDNAARNNKGTSAVAARAQKIASAPGNDEIKAKLKALQTTKEPLDAQVSEVVNAQATSTNAVAKISGANANMRGLDAAFKSAKLKAEYAEAKAKVEETTKTAEEVISLMVDVSKGAASEGPAGAAAALGEKLGPKIAVMAAAAAGVPGLSLTPEEAGKDKQADVEAENAKVNQYNAARTQLQTATKEASTTLTGFMNKVALLDQKKKDNKKAMDELGAAMDAAEAKTGTKGKPGELGTFQTITTFLGEADGFLADARAAKQVGEGDLDRYKAGSVAQDANKKQIAARSLHIYIPDAWRVQPTDGPKRFNIASQTIDLDFGGKDSAADSDWEHADGGLSTIKEAVHAIEKFIQEIEAYRNELRASLGT